MIHVCFGLHDKTGRYSKLTGTAMLSLFENTDSDVTIHILHDNTLTQDNRDKFNWLAGHYNQLVKFYNVDKIAKDDKILLSTKLITSEQTRFSTAMFYRFFIHKLLPPEVTKVIYLDSDLIINLDIAEFWKIELEDEPLAAVQEISNGVDPQIVFRCCQDGFIAPEDYFNSGVLLMNLAVLRNEENNLLKGIYFRAKHPEYVFFDQTILNYIFSKRYLRLPLKYNCLVKQMRKQGEMMVKSRIYHYAGNEKGLRLDTKDPFNKLWMDYFIKSPWFDVFALMDNIGNFFNELYEELGKARRGLLINLSTILAGRIRVFVLDEKKDIEWLKKTYSIREDEEILIYEGEEQLQKLIDAINESRNKKVFFIRARELNKKLQEAGLIEGKDYFNHYLFFVPKWSIRKDLGSLIKEM